MYIPPHFRDEDTSSLHAVIRESRLGNLITATSSGLMATPLPWLLDSSRGPLGVLLGHVAKANPQWPAPPSGEALVIFMGPDAYVSPSFYPSKAETGKAVPTWNYVTVHAYGTVEFFEDSGRLLEAVSRLTNRHEARRPEPWKVGDAPDAYIQSQLKGIVGVEVTITRLEGKRKLSQNRSASDREGTAAALGASSQEHERAVARLMTEPRT